MPWLIAVGEMSSCRCPSHEVGRPPAGNVPSSAGNVTARALWRSAQLAWTGIEGTGSQGVWESQAGTLESVSCRPNWAPTCHPKVLCCAFSELSMLCLPSPRQCLETQIQLVRCSARPTWPNCPWYFPEPLHLSLVLLGSRNTNKTRGRLFCYGRPEYGGSEQGEPLRPPSYLTICRLQGSLDPVSFLDFNPVRDPKVRVANVSIRVPPTLSAPRWNSPRESASRHFPARLASPCAFLTKQ